MKRFTGMLLAGGLVVAAAPAAAQSTIRPGETVQGSLTRSDRTLDDGSFYDCFRLQARAGERVSVTLRSNDFDAYLAVVEGRDCSSSGSAETDDDGAGGTDSLVRITLGSGPYSIRANSLSEGETGAYVLSVDALAALPKPEVRYLGNASIDVEGVLADGDAVAGDDSYFDCYAFDARAGQTWGISMLSDDFDAYLSLHEGATCDAEIESDDDSFGGTNAYIRHTVVRTGRYSVRANSLGSGETGRYSLTVEIE